jgi:hypothetical protein
VITSLIIPPLIPTRGTQGPVGEEELQSSVSLTITSISSIGFHIPGDKAQSLLLWQGCTCGNRRSSANNAWSGSCWGSENRHLVEFINSHILQTAILTAFLVGFMGGARRESRGCSYQLKITVSLGNQTMMHVWSEGFRSCCAYLSRT